MKDYIQIVGDEIVCIARYPVGPESIGDVDDATIEAVDTGTTFPGMRRGGDGKFTTPAAVDVPLAEQARELQSEETIPVLLTVAEARAMGVLDVDIVKAKRGFEPAKFVR